MIFMLDINWFMRCPHSHYPNGIPYHSEGLPGTGYPGKTRNDNLPQRGCVRRDASIPEEDATPLGLVIAGHVIPG